MRFLLTALAATALLATAGNAGTIQCRNAKGQIAKCGTPGAKPAAPKPSASGFKCKDGSTSNAKTKQGACSGHGGVAG